MIVAVTGATGFIGGHVAIGLARAGMHIRASGRDERRGALLAGTGADFYPGDLRDGACVNRLVQGVDAVVHCAALAQEWGPWHQFHENNVLVTSGLLRAARECGVRTFVHFSSPSVLFGSSGGHNREEHDVQPPEKLPAYARSKLMAEQMVQASDKGMKRIILRPQAVFGPGDRTLLPRIIALNNRLGIPLIEGGKHLVDTTCVENAVEAVRLGLQLAAPGCHVFNISNGEALPFAELVTKALIAAGEVPLFRRAPRAIFAAAAQVFEVLIALGFFKRSAPPLTRAGLVMISTPKTISIEHARSQLGYEPVVDLDTGLRNFGRWWMEQKGI